MNVYDLIITCIEYGGIGIVVLLTLIQIAPIKFNPWSSIAAAIGNAFNKNLIKEINEVEKQVADITKDVKQLDEKVKEEYAINARIRILRFGDEISHGRNHSRDHYQQILGDITMYNQYCIDNPLFKNNITKIASTRIEEEYIKRDKTNSFLV